MTRRQILLAGIGTGGGLLVAQRLIQAPEAGGPTLRLLARTREPRDGVVQPVENEVLWAAGETGIIICDMWDDHHCGNSVRRLEAMIPTMNRVVSAARDLGVAIVHAPSGTMDFYADTPQRARVLEAPAVQPPVPIAKWCHLDPTTEAPLPIDDTTPCDDEVPGEERRVWTRQHADIRIDPADTISDDGQEIFNYFSQQGIGNVVLMGVHTNMCVLGRPFGIRQQVRLGMNVVLARDLTDAMYDPRDPPFVSHERGTELVVEHIEQFWCPSIASRDLAVAAAVS